MKFAIPLENGKLTAHFGHCHVFALIEVAENEITNKEMLIPPPHEPGRPSEAGFTAFGSQRHHSRRHGTTRH